jgi:cation:H+ antiporter
VNKLEYLILVVGFFLLIKGADFFVDGASAISAIAKVPPLLIGLTIVAFGTSAPEAAVSFVAALKGSNDIVIGNVVGSNIFNLLIAIGISAIIRTVTVQKNTIIKEFPLAIYATLLMLFLSADGLIDGFETNVLTRTDGIVLLLGFAVFVFYLVELAFLSDEEDISIYDVETIPLSRSILFLILGLGMIVAGGNVVVKSATTIALAWGMSEALVGITIVAIGTSLPELVTSAAAAYKGQSDIAVGNIIGSGLFNILFVLGFSAVISPITVSSKLFFDFGFLIVITLISYLFSYTKKEIDRTEGIILTLMYVIYMVYIIIRN